MSDWKVQLARIPSTLRISVNSDQIKPTSIFVSNMKNWKEKLEKMLPDRQRSTLKDLPSHLVDAKKVEKLHTLLAEENKGRNAWFEVKEAYAETASYLEDVRLAWEQAEKELVEAPGVAIGRQCRYALITSSLNSLATNIPPELIAVLVEKQIWQPAQGLTYVRQSKNSKNQAAGLKAISKYLPPFLLSEALETARAIEAEYYRAIALQGLAPQLPEILPEALETARAIEEEYYRAKALEGLAPYLPKELLPEALEAVRAIGSEFWRAMALKNLIKRLTLSSIDFPLWQKILQNSASLNRDNFLVNLPQLAPLIIHL